MSRPAARRSTSPRFRHDRAHSLEASPDSLPKRSATLWCVRTGGPGPNAADRAQATEGRQTSGGAVAVAERSRTLGGGR
ncbi:hypothetical protein HrrHm2_010 [Halorubrum virus Humcor2]|nr:hypothetical protein HrrHm2_010 [Halorubrum virus Humcor2]